MGLRSEFEKRPISDEELLRECIEGNADAWSELVRKYKNLIFSIPLKYGLSRDDATDIFQETCLTLLQELPRLRDPKALPAWLIKVTSHRCFHRSRERSRVLAGAGELQKQPARSAVTEDVLDSTRREQILREVLHECPGRCRHLIEMLFFTHPAVPYERIAETLGVATGSVGFIRMRCLQRLRRELENRGFE